MKSGTGIRMLFTALLISLSAVCAYAQSGSGSAAEAPKILLLQRAAHSDGMALPRWGVKTNLLYDANSTINFGAEFRLGRQTSLDLPFNYNAWSFSENRKWKHLLLQPELRRWLDRTFDGHFFGVHAHYAFYNVSALPEPPFSRYMANHRFQGHAAGVGVSYGYRWNFDHRWALEATAGVGYAYLDYDKFPCQHCGEKIGSEIKHYLGPTRAGITLIYGIGGKPAPKPLYVAPVVPPAPIVIPYEPDLLAGYVVPETESVKTRSESGSAYLDFAVGRSEILPEFRDNAAELQKIHATIELVRNDPDATITGITITGYASPEDSYDYNMALSERRAQALKDHIQRIYGLRGGMFRVWGAGEDWKGLDSLVSASFLSDKYRLLEVIRGYGGDPDAREQQLKGISAGAAYRQLLADHYPKLRRSDYSIRYTVVPFTVQQGKQVFRSRPGNLSLNEMFLIANTYEPGSAAFNEVFETAARVFPESDVANLNAAATALARKDVAVAARYLGRVKEHTPAYWNNLGILAWLQGDKQKAAECFEKAGAQGQNNAQELRKHMDSMGRRR